jgi:hypothetical protein
VAHLPRVVVASSEEVLALHLLTVVAKSIATGGQVCIVLSEVVLSSKGEGPVAKCLLFHWRALFGRGMFPCG